MTEQLGRDVFMALASIGWADGKLDGNEADAIVRLATDEGLELEEIAEIEEATKDPANLKAVDLVKLSEVDRLFVYAVATWMTRVDGRVDEGEVERLRDLGERLAVPEDQRIVVDGLSRDVGEAGESPLRFDLGRLRALIVQRFQPSA